MNYTVGIVAPRNYPHWGVFWDVAACLDATLNPPHGRGMLIVDSPRAANIILDDRLLVLGANLLGTHWGRGIEIPSDAVLMNLEQAESGWFTEQYLALLRRHEVWDYSERNIEFLASAGIKAKLCRIGYHPCLTRIEPREETIDVLFYGSITERRERIIKSLCHAGIDVQTLFGCYGKPRDDFIAKAKLILNLHSYEGSPFEIVRMQLLFANRKCVVTETSGPDDQDFQLYRGCMVEIDPDDVESSVFTIKGLLADQDTRWRIGKLGFEAFANRPQKDLLPP